MTTTHRPLAARLADATLARMDRAALAGCTAPLTFKNDPREWGIPRTSGPMSEPYRWHNILFVARRTPHGDDDRIYYQAWNRVGPIMPPSLNRKDAIDAIDRAEFGPVSAEELERITAARARYEGWSHATY